jgi:hypothetical protein
LNGLIAPRSTDGSHSKPFNQGQMAGFDKSGRLRADHEMAGSGSRAVLIGPPVFKQLNRKSNGVWGWWPQPPEALNANVSAASKRLKKLGPGSSPG